MPRKTSSQKMTDQFELDFSSTTVALSVDPAPVVAVAAPSPEVIIAPVIPVPSTPALRTDPGSSPWIIYTDGGCEPNPGRGGWAAIIIEPGGANREMCGTVEDSTNNRMEIWAALQALQSLPPGVSATVHTDSQYVQKGATEWLKGWKYRGWVNSAKQPVANKDLWLLIDTAISQRKVTWKWVRGHADNAHNNRCDVLANAAAKGKPLLPSSN